MNEKHNSKIEITPKLGIVLKHPTFDLASKLDEKQMSILYLRFADNCDNSTLAKELGISEDAARMRINRSVNNLINILGGSRPNKERDYTEEEMHDAENRLRDNAGDATGDTGADTERELEEPADS